jgi:hypothetical protein
MILKRLSYVLFVLILGSFASCGSSNGTTLAKGAVALSSASTFGIMATSAITDTGASTIKGDVSLEPGSSCDLLPAQVTGTIHKNDSVSAQARADLLVAYNFATDLAPGTAISDGQDLGALDLGFGLGVLHSGTYTSGSTMLVATPLTLDAQGNADAVWVFQIGSSLTTTTPTGTIVLKNGAQSKNVFWVPVEDAVIGSYTTFYGTIISGRDVTCATGATIDGRLLAGATTDGTIALDACTINVPTP